VTAAWELGLTAERDAFRAALGGLGFTDDGDLLRGPAPWQHPDGRALTATVDVRLDDRFPFAPPMVQVVDPGVELELTFHREPDGTLCLWTSDELVESAPWRDPEQLLQRIRGWLSKTAAGWPGDDDCDLERYLPRDDRMILYDLEALAGITGCVRTSTNHRAGIVTITTQTRRTPMSPPKAKRGLPRKDQHLAWVANIGQPARPIWDWEGLLTALSNDQATVDQLVRLGAIDFALLHYQRHGQAGVLALALQRSRLATAPIVRACESADTGLSARTLRAGSTANQLTNRSVAIVGLGAVGSFLADLLYRSGVGRLTLVDPERLRPGNIVRHLAGDAFVNLAKVHAVRAQLSALGLDVTWITGQVMQVATPARAIDLLATHDLVVDATANARATALLRWAAEQTGHPLVSVCLQREGALARADRFPLRGDEQHLAPVPSLSGPLLPREPGCADPVSLTPPVAVLAAAELGCRLAIDQLHKGQDLPATLLNVLIAQADPPYDHIGLLSATRDPTRTP
jgi:molybdopterin/thiamine biosynthesis adenylyltransferase